MPSEKPPIKELDTKYFINVNPEGTFEDYKLLGLGFNWNKVKTSPKDIVAMFDDIRAKQKRHLAIFFHGGLVNEYNGMDAAHRFHQFYNLEPDLHTVSFVWETGFMTSLVEHFKAEVKSEPFQWLLKEVAKKTLDKLGLQVPDIPGMKFAETINQHAEEIVKPQNERLILERARAFEERSLREIEEDLVSDLPPFEQKIYFSNIHSPALVEQKNLLGLPWLAKLAIKSTARCIYRFAIRRNHGILATIQEEVYRQIKYASIGIESLATGIWSEMKEQAESMWKSNTKRKGDNQFAGRFFLDELKKYLKENKAAGHEVTVELVAHSAGSIAVCKLFELLKKEHKNYADIRFNNIIFLAPACKCDLFHETIMTMTDRFREYRQFIMDQETEEKDILVDINGLNWVYPMSLLYFVSGLCEDGDKWFDEDVKGDACILGLHQHIRNNKPYSKNEMLEDIHKFLVHEELYKSKLALVPSAGDAPVGYCGHVTDHGYFDNDSPDDAPNSIKKSIKYLFTLK